MSELYDDLKKAVRESIDNLNRALEARRHETAEEWLKDHPQTGCHPAYCNVARRFCADEVNSTCEVCGPCPPSGSGYRAGMLREIDDFLGDQGMWIGGRMDSIKHLMSEYKRMRSVLSNLKCLLSEVGND